MNAAAVGEGVYEKEDSVDGAEVFCFKLVAYAFLGEEGVKSEGDVGRRKVEVEADGGGLLWNGGKKGVGGLEDEGADGKERNLGIGEAGNAEERF